MALCAEALLAVGVPGVGVGVDTKYPRATCVETVVKHRASIQAEIEGGEGVEIFTGITSRHWSPVVYTELVNSECFSE